MFPAYIQECPKGMLELIHTITDEQVNADGRMKLGDLARQMQILTEQHFDLYSGTMIKELNEAGLSWIIAWSQIYINRLPELGEKIRMRVWAGKKKAVLHTRKYAFYTMDGTPLLSTASLFVLMDRNTRKMAADPAGMKEAQIVTVPDEPVVPKMNLQFPSTLSKHQNRTVRPDEIDYNGHLNNSHYLDWAEDLPGEVYLKKHIPRSVWIEYTKELLEGQKAELLYDVGSDILYVQGISQGEQSFRMKVEYDAPAGQCGFSCFGITDSGKKDSFYTSEENGIINFC